jgi:hypothetical protein
MWQGRDREGASDGSLRCSAEPSTSEAPMRRVNRGGKPTFGGEAQYLLVRFT